MSPSLTRNSRNFPSIFWPLFNRHLQQVHLCGPLYLSLSGVTRPLHRHLKPFTTNGTLYPRPSVGGFGGGLCRLWKKVQTVAAAVYKLMSTILRITATSMVQLISTLPSQEVTWDSKIITDKHPLHMASLSRIIFTVLWLEIAGQFDPIYVALDRCYSTAYTYQVRDLFCTGSWHLVTAAFR